MGRHVLVYAPLLGCAVLAVLARADEASFRVLVREDSVLEWAQVGAYVIASVAAAFVARRAHGAVRLAYVALAVSALAAIGEEISWGQRLFELATPESLAVANAQEELSVHNVGAAETGTRAILLVAALYGAVAPFVRRAQRLWPLVPPRELVSAFGVVVGYFAVRFALLPEPTYMQAKFSEWPEFCFAAAVAVAAVHTLRRVRVS